MLYKLQQQRRSFFLFSFLFQVSDKKRTDRQKKKVNRLDYRDIGTCIHMFGKKIIVKSFFILNITTNKEWHQNKDYMQVISNRQKRA